MQKEVSSPLVHFLKLQEKALNQGLDFSLKKEEKEKLFHLPEKLKLYVYSFLGNYYFERHRFDQALKFYRPVMEAKHPFLSPRALFWSGVIWKSWLRKGREKEKVSPLFSKAKECFSHLVFQYPYSLFALDALEELVTMDLDLRKYRKGFELVGSLPLTKSERRLFYSLLDRYFEAHPEEVDSLHWNFLAKYFWTRKKDSLLWEKFPHHPLALQSLLNWVSLQIFYHRFYPSRLDPGYLQLASREEKRYKGCSRPICQTAVFLLRYLQGEKTSFPQGISEKARKVLCRLSQKGCRCAFSEPFLKRWGKIWRVHEIWRSHPLEAARLLRELGAWQDEAFVIDALFGEREISLYFRKQPGKKLYTLGVFYLRRGEYEKAKEMFQKLAETSSPVGELAKVKLHFSERLLFLEQKAQWGSEEALWRLAKIYERYTLLFYNRLLWKGERSKYLCRFLLKAPWEVQGILKEYLWLHNPLERALSIYEILKKREEEKAEQAFLQCRHRLFYHFNLYYYLVERPWREKKFQ